MEVQRLLGMGWQWKRSKMGFSPMGRPSSREPLGGSPLGYCPSPLLPSLPFYLSWPTGTTAPYHLGPTTRAPHLNHSPVPLYHLYYPRGEMSKKVCWSKAKCIAAPHLWDLDHAEAWRGHPLAKKPRTVRAHALCADCPLIRDCAVYALTATPRMAGVVMAGVDIPVAGGAKARAARKRLREIAYG